MGDVAMGTSPRLTICKYERYAIIGDVDDQFALTNFGEKILHSEISE